MNRFVMASILTLAMAGNALAQCGARSVDFGNANLGAQLCQGGNCNLSQNAASNELAELRAQLAAAARPGQNAIYDDGHTYMAYAAKEPYPFQNVAYRRQGAAAASASAGGGGTSPGMLTFRESNLQPVPEISSDAEVAELRALVAEMRQELDYQRSMARQTSGDRVMYLTGAGGGGAAASASSSTSAPSQANIAFTAPAPSAQSRNSQSACSSGGCGGGGRAGLLGRIGGGRQVSRSRSFSSTTTN